MLHNVRTAIQRPNEQKEVQGKMVTPLIYVASGNSIVSLLQSLPYSLTKKEFLLPGSIQKILQPEILGAIDFIVCEKSDDFIGFSQSTFSALVVLRRHYQNKSGIFYDSVHPPWQIALSLDPKEKRFQMKKKEKKKYCDSADGKLADDMFFN